MKTKKHNALAIKVHFRHMPKSSSIKALARQQAERLRHFDLAGGHCEVTIDETHHRRKSGVYKVTLRLTVPGQRVFVAHAEEKSSSEEYLYASVLLAFDEIERQLEKREHRTRRRETRSLAA